MTNKQWQYIETLLDDILAFPSAKRKLQLAKWFGDDDQMHALASRLVQLSDQGVGTVDLPAEIGGWVPLRCLGSHSGNTDYLVQSGDDANHPLAILHLGGIAFEEGPAIQDFREALKRVDSLSSETVCGIYDAGLDYYNHPYIVKEFVTGTPILDAARDLSTRSIVELFRKLLINVDNAHSQKVAHGSFHPAHILCGTAGSIRTAGFAVPRILALASKQPGFKLKPETTVNEILYFAPEKLKGQPDQLSGDIYSLGVIFYQMLSGLPPYGNREESLVELANVISDKQPSKIAGLEDVLNQILLKMLAKNPGERFANLASIATELDDYLQGRHLKSEVKATSAKASFAHSILQQGHHRWVAAALGFVLVASAGVGIKSYTAAESQPVSAQVQTQAPVVVQKTPLQVAAGLLNSTFEEAKNQPELQRNLAQAYLGLSAVESPQQALEASKRAFELSSMVLDRGPVSDNTALEYALAARTHIYYLALNGKYNQAIEVNQQWQARAAKTTSSNIEIIRASALANTTLANVQYESKLSTSPSESVYRRDIESLQKTGARTENDHARFAQSMLGLGEAIELTKQPGKAIEIYSQTRRTLEQAAQQDGKNQDLKTALADVLIHAARLNARLGNPSGAVEDSVQAIQLARQSITQQGNKQALQRLLARALATNASALVSAKRAPEAIKVQGEAIAQWQLLDRSFGLDSTDKAELNKARNLGRG